MKYFSLSLFLSLVAFSEASNSSACLSVTLYDSFGDGWGSAFWYYETPTGLMHYAAPNCSVNPVLVNLCGSSDGLYYLVVSSGESDMPQNSWEVGFLTNC